MRVAAPPPSSSSSAFPSTTASGGGGGGEAPPSLLRVTTYPAPPSGRETLDAFESLSFERLKVLQQWEGERARSVWRSDEASARLGEMVRGTHMELRGVEDRRKDNLSHWVLEMAMCSTEDDRRRFVAFEQALFEFRYNAVRNQPAVIAAFFNAEGLRFTPIPESEKRDLDFELRCVFDVNAAAMTTVRFENVRFYKIPFAEVPDLVYARRNFLRGGFVYVTHLDLCKVLSNRFTAVLNTRLETAARNVPYHAGRDERLGGLLQGLRKKQQAGASYSRTLLDGEQITLADLPALAQRSFPMCGRALTRKLTVTTHHLFHDERLQYQLFLKGLGLSMEDCLAYWQREFTKKKTLDEYRKGGYAYSVRHSYGKEGKRADYTPWNCVKSVMANSGNLSQDGVKKEHGCPFVHMGDVKVLAKSLVEWGGVDPATAEHKIKEVVELARSSQPQLACRKHWELLHPGGNPGEVGNHPNAFVDHSIAYWKERKGDPPPQETAPPAAPPAAPAAERE